MEIKDGFSVEIASSYDQLWRYNLALTCGCFDDIGKGSDNPRKDFIAAEDFIAPVGANLTRCPDDYPADRTLRFTTVSCDYLLMYLYVIPHTLPQERDISDCEPFPLRITVKRGNAIIHEHLYEINCWSGASIELRLPAKP